MLTKNLIVEQLFQKKAFFNINQNDNIITLKQKTQKLEYQVFPEAIIKIFRNI